MESLVQLDTRAYEDTNHFAPLRHDS